MGVGVRVAVVVTRSVAVVVPVSVSASVPTLLILATVVRLGRRHVAQQRRVLLGRHGRKVDDEDAAAGLDSADERERRLDGALNMVVDEAGLTEGGSDRGAGARKAGTHKGIVVRLAERVGERRDVLGAQHGTHRRATLALELLCLLVELRECMLHKLERSPRATARPRTVSTMPCEMSTPVMSLATSLSWIATLPSPATHHQLRYSCDWQHEARGTHPCPSQSRADSP